MQVKLAAGRLAQPSLTTLADWIKLGESIGIRCTLNRSSDYGTSICMSISATTAMPLLRTIEAFADMRGLTPESMPHER
jgi:hypothetical protein